MAELPNDIVLDIMSHLPLNHVVGCCILNKDLYNHISTPQFARDHALLSSPPTCTKAPIILHCSSNHTNFTTFNNNNNTSPIPKSITLPNEITILNSCNGVVLLHCTWSANHYLFNPLTGALKFLDIKTTSFSIGLAVDHRNFTLISLDTKTTPSGQTLIRFRDLSTKKRSVDLYHAGTFALSTARPVYAHGCLHWISDDASEISAYDVACRRARFMGGPTAKTGEEDSEYFHSWFGVAEHALQFVYTTREGVVVCTHNYVTQNWRVAYKIPNASVPVKGVRMFWDVVPVFYDGGRDLWLHVKSGAKGEIYVHDLMSDTWKKMGEVGEDEYRNYVEFVPTRARVSDVCLSELSDKRRSKQKGLCLLGLQQLLRMDSNEFDFDDAIKSKTKKDIKLTSIRKTIEKYIRNQVD